MVTGIPVSELTPRHSQAITPCTNECTNTSPKDASSSVWVWDATHHPQWEKSHHNPQPLQLNLQKPQQQSAGSVCDLEAASTGPINTITTSKNTPARHCAKRPISHIRRELDDVIGVNSASAEHRPPHQHINSATIDTPTAKH